MSGNELTRIVKRKPLPAEPMIIEANAEERAALARRFAITAVDTLTATLNLSDKGSAVLVEGELRADIVQPCAVSGEDFAHSITEEISLRFVPAAPPPAQPDMEFELEAEDLDELEYEGESFDLGEAVAQSLGLAIDPYAEGPNADEARAKAGIKSDDAPSTGALAEALKGLRP